MKKFGGWFKKFVMLLVREYQWRKFNEEMRKEKSLRFSAEAPLKR